MRRRWFWILLEISSLLIISTAVGGVKDALQPKMSSNRQVGTLPSRIARSDILKLIC
jgi:hypothetical protein